MDKDTEDYYTRRQQRADEVVPYLAWMGIILILCLVAQGLLGSG